MSVNHSASPNTGEPAYKRRDVTFGSHGSPCAAWLYEPPFESSSPRPALVMAHGLGAVRELRLHEFAERFARSGYAVLVFDYRHFGASGGHPRQVVDIAEQLEDWHSALAYIRAHPDDFDRERIAIWGSSFGGGHVLQVAADDGKLSAVISQCPFTDGPASFIARIRTAPISAPILLVAGLVDRIAELFGRDPVLIPMVGTPAMPAFLAAPDALPGALALVPPSARLSGRTARTLGRFPSIVKHLPAKIDAVSDRPINPLDDIWGVLESEDGSPLMRNAIAARLALTIARYRPGKALAETSIPTLVCVGTDDSVAPAAATIKHTVGLAHVTQRSYPTGHFDIYVDPWFERVVSDQIEFLTQHVPV
ncbi:alpha/beta hydrolase [Gordonia sp. CPCC 205333]|uniref:alpha/beta hydrolase n=1 Tax=Gordonia sp. CPCC 205333 TaxID=3140790 RepID=UPI003AF35246